MYLIILGSTLPYDPRILPVPTIGYYDIPGTVPVYERFFYFLFYYFYKIKVYSKDIDARASELKLLDDLTLTKFFTYGTKLGTPFPRTV